MSQFDLDSMHTYLKWMFPIDDIFVCPHDDGECECRKPKPGMILQAIKKYNLDPEECLMIGNEDRDIEAGKRAGIKTLLWRHEHHTESPWAAAERTYQNFLNGTVASAGE